VSVVGEKSALLGFFADAQQCFTTALMIREATLTQDRYRDLLLRIGITLGQAEISDDGFGNPQVSGEARQDADRLIRLGPPCQISASRQFVEVLSRTAPELAHLLESRGLYSDSAGPPLYLYTIPPSQTGSGGRRIGTLSAAGDSRLPPPLPATIPPKPTAKHSDGLKRLLLGCVLLSLLAGVAVVSLSDRQNGDSTLAASAPQTATSTPEALPAPVVPKKTTDSGGAKPITPRSKHNRPRPIGTSDEPITGIAQYVPLAEQEAPAGSNEARRSPQPVESARIDEPAPLRETSPIQALRSGTVFLAVKPWGEVFVDGRQLGITPPLKKFDLPVGPHVITVMNSSLPIYQRELNVEPETTVAVVHDFTCESTRDKICREGFGKGLAFRSRLSSDTADAGLPPQPSRQ